MAVLTPDQVREMRNIYEKDPTDPLIDRIKSDANLVLQAIEDEWETNTRAAMSVAIDAVVTGLTGPQKKAFGRAWMRVKFDLGG